MQLKAVLDRFEGNYAVLLFGEEEIRASLPRLLLPPGAVEGSLLNVTFELDPGEEHRQRERIEELLQKLEGKRE